MQAPSPCLLALLSAAFSSACTIALKAWSSNQAFLLFPIIATCVVCALVLEAQALRSARLGMTYITILACEIILVAIASRIAFDEPYTSRELLGCAMIAAGAVLTCS